MLGRSSSGVTITPDQPFYRLDCKLPAYAVAALEERRTNADSYTTTVQTCLNVVHDLAGWGRNAYLTIPREHSKAPVRVTLHNLPAQLAAYVPPADYAHTRLSVPITSDHGKMLLTFAKQVPGVRGELAEVAAIAWSLSRGAFVRAALEVGTKIFFVDHRGREHPVPRETWLVSESPQTPAEIQRENPSLPVADGERQAAEAQLREQVAAGRLDLAGYETRCVQILKAKTTGDLINALDLTRPVTRDVPAVGPGVKVTPWYPGGRSGPAVGGPGEPPSYLAASATAGLLGGGGLARRATSTTTPRTLA